MFRRVGLFFRTLPWQQCLKSSSLQGVRKPRQTTYTSNWATTLYAFLSNCACLLPHIFQKPEKVLTNWSTVSGGEWGWVTWGRAQCGCFLHRRHNKYHSPLIPKGRRVKCGKIISEWGPVKKVKFQKHQLLKITNFRSTSCWARDGRGLISRFERDSTQFYCLGL